jgi:alpha-beta hydrolase superfamily lysophospholipase
VITAADGHIVPHKTVFNGSDALVVISHGITSDKEEGGLYTEFAEKLLASDFDSIRFDFRGHGESAISSDQTTITGALLDLMAVMQWARNQGYRKLFHLASSFGGSISLLAFSRFSFCDFAAVAFWNPVTNYHNTFIEPKVEWAKTFFDQEKADELAYRPSTLIPPKNFVISPQMAMELLLLRPQETIWPTQPPLLIFHGDADAHVPFADAAAYSERNSENVTLRCIKGASHGFGCHTDTLCQETIEWFKQQR